MFGGVKPAVGRGREALVTGEDAREIKRVGKAHPRADFGERGVGGFEQLAVALLEVSGQEN